MAQEEAKFRFVDLEIWQDSIEVAERLFDLADGLEAKRLYRFAGMVCGAVPRSVASLRTLRIRFAFYAMHSAPCA